MLFRSVFPIEMTIPDLKVVKLPPQVDMKDLIKALGDIMKRADNYAHHRIQSEPLSVRERMSVVLGVLKSESFTEFTSLFTIEEGRGGVVVTLLAILELLKQSLVEIVQTETFGLIHVKAAGQSASNDNSQ